MSDEPRHRIYTQIFQRSYVAAVRGLPDPDSLARALMLDPHEAGDAFDLGEFPPYRLADFCSHRDKGALPALLETIATWVRKEVPQYPSESLVGVAKYSRPLMVWCALPLVPFATAGLRLEDERAQSAVDQAVAALSAWKQPRQSVSDVAGAQRRLEALSDNVETSFRDSMVLGAVAVLCRSVTRAISPWQFPNRCLDSMEYAEGVASAPESWRLKNSIAMNNAIVDRLLRYQC